ncbi:exosome complex component MTR3-like [Strongylocentrotus purpuratus]|uniref:Exoribonuclease phosphorolytic domain-containing protein n=1 Tax=Strongylocentrotus purpuratus TaxID=7668 RepID=A0A7M7STL8_STRPU|nr:exosome complex component MTR3-like [Strongylocentrotus purpuratus]
MPTDTKRIQGPDASQSTFLYKKRANTVQPALLEEGKRQDGRSPLEIRPIFLKAGAVSQAKGSCYMEMKNTKVICAVYGPREVPRRDGFVINGQLRCEFKFATFASEVRHGHLTSHTEKDLALQVQQALEPAVCLHKIPKSQVDIFITVLENDGSVLSAAITCASIAVANAGIEMYDLVIGSSLRQTGETLLLDPTAFDETAESESTDDTQAIVTVGFLPSLKQVSCSVQQGQLQCEDSIKALQQCIDVCERYYQVVYECLKKSVKKLKSPVESPMDEAPAS